MAFWKAFGTWISFTMAMCPRQIQWISTTLGKCQNVILSKCGISNHILFSSYITSTPEIVHITLIENIEINKIYLYQPDNHNRCLNPYIIPFLNSFQKNYNIHKTYT